MWNSLIAKALFLLSIVANAKRYKVSHYVIETYDEPDYYTDDEANDYAAVEPFDYSNDVPDDYNEYIIQDYAKDICEDPGVENIACTSECHLDLTCTTINKVKTCGCDGKGLFVTGTAKYKQMKLIEKDKSWKENEKYMKCEPCTLFCRNFLKGKKIRKGLHSVKKKAKCDKKLRVESLAINAATTAATTTTTKITATSTTTAAATTITTTTSKVTTPNYMECTNRGLIMITCTADCHSDLTCNTHNHARICSCDGQETIINGDGKYRDYKANLIEKNKAWADNEQYMRCEPCTLLCGEFNGPGIKTKKGLPVKETIDCK